VVQKAEGAEALVEDDTAREMEVIAGHSAMWDRGDAGGGHLEGSVDMGEEGDARA
jgi:hypothetical protein